MANIYHLSFSQGWQQLRQCDVAECRKRLMDALRVNNRTSFSKYKNGQISIHPAAKREVERIFNSYGITDVWIKPCQTDLEDFIPQP